MRGFKRGFCIVGVFCFVLVIGFQANEATGGTYTTINYPGSNGTLVNAVSGDNVVGYYGDGTTGQQYGFLYSISAGTYTRIDGPVGAVQTVAFGVSGNNIYGFYKDAGLVDHLFLYDGSNYTDVAYPGAAVTQWAGYSSPISGNNLVGQYGLPVVGWQGFLFNGSTYSTLVPPGGYNVSAVSISGNNVIGTFDSASGRNGYLYNIADNTYATIHHPDTGAGVGTENIAVSGNTVLGQYLDSGHLGHGFLYNSGNYTTLPNPPAAKPSDPGGPGHPTEYHTHFRAISGSNVVGYYYDTDNRQHGFLYSGSDFSITDIDAPGATSTAAVDVSGDNIVGIYSNGRYYGFIYTVPEPSTIALLGIGIIGLIGWAWRRSRSG